MPNPENIEKHKFEKGESGNPNGRPKGARNRSTIVRQWLDVEQRLKNPITGSEEQMNLEDFMTLAQIKKAREGDTQAYKALLDSAYGTPDTNIDITTQGDKINGKPEWLK